MTRMVNRRDFLKMAGGVTAGTFLAGGFWNWPAVSSQFNSELKQDKPPNVILIVLDTVRAKSLSLFGYERPTSPQLAKLSERGVLFRNAISTSPWTLPSHASMFTGHWPNKLGTSWIDPLNGNYTVLAEMLRDNGYQTAGFTANRNYCSREFGLAQGFEHFEDYRLTLGQMAMSEALSSEVINKTKAYEIFARDDNFGRKSAEQLNQDFIHWLGKQGGDQPFFAFLNYYDAHDPYLPPGEYATAYSDIPPYGHITDETMESHTPEDVRQLNDAYDGVVTYLDYQVGRLIQAISTYDWFENTLILVTSDHGEQFGEHNLLSHANSLYLELLHVFLILIYPGKLPSGKKVDVPVTLRNIPATILELVGIQNQGTFPGKSLTRYWNGSVEEEMLYSYHEFGAAAVPQDIYTGRVESLIFKGYHYIQDTGGVKELYDLRHDPNELNNLANMSKYQRTIGTYQKYIEQVASSP